MLLAAITEEAGAAVGLAKDLAAQGDRVLFIVALALLVGFAGYIVKVFLRKIDQKDDQLVQLTKQYSSDALQVKEALNKVTEAVDDNTQVIGLIKAKLNLAVAIFLAIGSLFVAGCSTPGSSSTQQLSALVEVAAYTGSSIQIQEHPDQRPAFVAAHQSILKLIGDKQYSPAALASALSGLKIREFKGSKGQLIVTSALILWDSYAPSVTAIDSEAKVLPVLNALDRGISKALSDNP